jgi:hypothetical protein
MPVIIEIDAPHLLPHLVSRLQAADCWAAPISSSACRVVHRQAETVDEAVRELRFFASAWAGSHGNVSVNLRPVA